MDLFDFNVTCQVDGSLSKYIDPTDCISEYLVDIRYCRENSLKPAKIGMVHLLRVNANLANEHGFSLFDACDGHSQGLMEYHNALFKHRSNELKTAIVERFEAYSGEILILNLCAIDPRYRGHGLGLLASRRCIDLFGSGCDFVACFPCPMQVRGAFDIPESYVSGFGSTKTKLGRIKLQRHWSQLGFSRIGRSKYFGLSLNHKHPTFNELVDMLVESNYSE